MIQKIIYECNSMVRTCTVGCHKITGQPTEKTEMQYINKIITRTENNHTMYLLYNASDKMISAIFPINGIVVFEN